MRMATSAAAPRCMICRCDGSSAPMLCRSCVDEELAPARPRRPKARDDDAKHQSQAKARLTHALEHLPALRASAAPREARAPRASDPSS